MDMWKYFAVTHRDHVIMNPISSAGLDEVLDLAVLPRGARVLDIGCGKGELLLRLAQRGAGTAIGIDRSPYTAEEARDRVRTLGPAVAPQAEITILEQDGAAFTADPESFDLTACLGASWIFGGFRGTLRALAGFTRPGGLILVAEPFWRTTPDPEYLASLGLRAEDIGTHLSNASDGAAEGLALLFSRACEGSDWDRYEGLQWRAAEEWARANPDDPDVAEVLGKTRGQRDAYLRWGRETLGDALYLFLKP